MSLNDAIALQTPLAEGFIKSYLAAPFSPALYINGVHYTYNDLFKKAVVVFNGFDKNNFPAYVGIYTCESVWTYAAILAVSLAGAAYVPLNPKLPIQKLQTIIASCKLQLIISERTLPFVHDATELIIDPNIIIVYHPITLVQQDIAYLLFTSGTTGEPKGVPVSKKNVNVFFNHFKNNYDFRTEDKFLQPYELSFDVSVFSIFAAWNSGASVYVVPEEGFKYLSCMTMIKEHDITVSSIVPTVLWYVEKYLPQFNFSSLRYSFFSGDKLFQDLAVKWSMAAPESKIINCYGPTETTIVCTSYNWDKNISKKESVNNIVPLGKAFAEMDFVFLDENANVNFSSGELCFTGQQVIDNYLNCKFENSFFMYNGKRYYKTGDLAALNAQQNLTFLGRTDSQVKINGFRTELLEIEQMISKLTQRNVVVLLGNVQNIDTLYAFVEGETMDEIKLKSSLSQIISAHMMPTSFKFIKTFQLNINGKIDTQHLKNLMHESRNN